MNIVFTRSKEGLSAKPQGKQVAKWQQPSRYTQEQTDVESIAQSISNGCCWRAGIYDKDFTSFKKANANGSQVIALDFDGSEGTPDKVLEHAESLGIPASIVYATFSQDSSSWDKWIEEQKSAKKLSFESHDYKYIYSRGNETTKNEAKKAGYNYRVMWCLSSIVSVKDYEDIQKALMILFDAYNPDKSTKDVSRLWFGSKLTTVVISQEPRDATTLKAVCGQVAVSRKMQEGGRIRSITKGKKELIPDYAELPEQQVVTVGDDWYERLRYVCPLWDKYEDGEYMNYNERLTLFSNLKYLSKNSNNSTSIYKDILSFYKPEVWQRHSFDEEQLRTMLTTTTLKAVPIVRAEGKHMTVPEYLSKSEKVIIPKDRESYISLKELDAYLDEKIPALLASKGIQYFSSQTGSGKTKRIIDFLGKYLDGTKKVIYACPHFAGADEFYQRFTASGFGYKVKKLPEQQLTAKDKLLLQLGLPKRTKCSERAEFIDEMINSNNGLYIVTHSLLVNMPTIKADIIIIDENIESSLIRTSILTYPQLYSLFPFLDYETKRRFMTWLEKTSKEPRGTKIKLDYMREKVAPQLHSRIEEYLESEAVSSSLIPSGFFNCEDNDGVCSVSQGQPAIRISHISPLIKDAMEQGIPVKLFSATPIPARISNYYGIDIDVIEAPKAKNSGKIIQYNALSGAKGTKQSDDTFSKLPTLAKYVRESLGEDIISTSQVISFKGTSDFWQKEGFNVAEAEEGKQTHFKNNCGLDCFKGKSLIVIGKYDVNPDYYLGVWDDIGDGTEPRQQNCLVELNGVKQNLYLWDKPQLRAEQLQNLAEASEQTAGRARALRECGATVYLFSNYIVSGVDEVRK